MGNGVSGPGEAKQHRHTLASYSRSTLAHDLLQEALKDDEEKAAFKSTLPFKLSVHSPKSPRRNTYTGGSLMHRDSATSDLDRLSRFFRELLSDPGLRGCFRDYLCKEHLAEHLILAWVDMEQLKRACDRFIRCVKGIKGQQVTDATELRALFEDTACKCDDLYNKYLGDSASHSVSVSVDQETRADVSGSIQHLLKVVQKAYLPPPEEVKGGKRVSLGDKATVQRLSHSHAATDKMEQIAAMRGVRKYVSAAQTKVFTAMLFDYLPGFITSEQSSNSKSAINSAEDVRTILESGVRAARKHSAMGCPLSPTGRGDDAHAGPLGGGAEGVCADAPEAVIASMQLHCVVADPTCSMYLESYLNRVADKIKAAGVGAEVPGGGAGGAPVMTLGFTPDLVIACLLEIDDFKRADDRYHMSHRASLILQRYGVEELGCQEMIALKNSRKFVDSVDGSMFDLVYVLLSTKLLVEHGEGFMSSPEFKDLERVLSSQSTGCTVVNTAAKVGSIRGYVLEKLGLKEAASDPSRSLELRAMSAEANVEELLRTLEGVLSLALGRSLFKRFSIQQFQEENVCFYLEVMHFKNEQYLVPPDGSIIFADRSNVVAKCGAKAAGALSTGVLSADMDLAEMRRLRAEHICTKYIEVGSRRQINISSAMRNNILNTVRRTATATLNTTATIAAADAGAGSADQDKDDDGDVEVEVIRTGSNASADEAGKWAPPLNVFTAAQREVLHLMKLNLWLKFQASPLYHSLNRQVRKRAAISVMVKAGQISTALLQGQTSTQAAMASANSGSKRVAAQGG